MIKKFRAWDKGLKEMLFIDNIFNMTEKFSERGKLGYFILMQFTGLLDKNGVEIYEGDIIGGDYNGLFINWCNKCKTLRLFCKIWGNEPNENLEVECMTCDNDDSDWDEFLNNKKLEVIGNIYNNKELIK